MSDCIPPEYTSCSSPSLLASGSLEEDAVSRDTADQQRILEQQQPSSSSNTRDSTLYAPASQPDCPRGAECPQAVSGASTPSAARLNPRELYSGIQPDLEVILLTAGRRVDSFPADFAAGGS